MFACLKRDAIEGNTADDDLVETASLEELDCLLVEADQSSTSGLIADQKPAGDQSAWRQCWGCTVWCCKCCPVESEVADDDDEDAFSN